MTGSIPAGWHSVTPRLVSHDADKLVEFLKQAFGGTGDFHSDMPYGDRRSIIKDPAGNIWQIATHNEEAFLEFIRQRSAGKPSR